MELPPGHNPETHEAEGSWWSSSMKIFRLRGRNRTGKPVYIGWRLCGDPRREHKRLTLPGSPVGDFGLLFGPRVREKSLSLSFSFLATKKGRRLPALAAGLGGVRSYRFRLNAATKEILLFRHDLEIGKVAYQWESGAWHSVCFQAIPGAGENTRIRLKLWKRGEKEPDEWLLDRLTRVHLGEMRALGLPVFWDAYPF